MIFLDASETRSTSTMPEIPDATIVDNLEELTGADMMVSPFPAPASSEALIKTHLSHGAQLVQVKRGRDLASSMGERLSFSLAKMQSTGASQSQCVLLFVGIMTCDAQNQAVVNKQPTGRQFMHLQAALEGWNDRGGVVTFLPRASLIPEWCRMRSRRLQEYQNNPERTVYPNPPRIEAMHKQMQIIRPVKDARKTIVTLPGLGEKNTNMLWDEFGNAADIFVWLSLPVTKDTSIKGIAQGTKDKIRAYFGLDEVMVFGYEVSDILLKRAEDKAQKGQV